MALNPVYVPMTAVTESRLIGNVVLVAITLFVVALRILTRLVTGSKLGWDDYFTLMCVPQGIGLLICQGLFSTAGIAYDLEELPEDNILYMYDLVIPFDILYNLCIAVTKVSVLFFYLRVFTTERALRRATKGMLIFVGLWGTANFLQALFVCRVNKKTGAVEFRPDLNINCSAQVLSFLLTGIFNCTTNTVINFLPLYTIWSLKTITVSTRWGLTAVFLLGINVTWVSVLRITGLISSDYTEPFTVMAELIYLTVLEANLSILCNSLPMLLPLYSYWRYRKFFGEGEDEYVSRLGGTSRGHHLHHSNGSHGGGGGGGKHPNGEFVLQNVTNGLPLETIYGQDHVHFSATVDARSQKSSRRMTRRISLRSVDEWDSESTRPLEVNAAGTEGIKIETHWTITETREGGPSSSRGTT